MNVLCIGDVVGGIGCRHLQAVLPRLKRELHVAAPDGEEVCRADAARMVQVLSKADPV